jgi:hypothetical protein
MSDDPKHEQTQRDRFIETARDISADEDEAAFKTKLAKLSWR